MENHEKIDRRRDSAPLCPAGLLPHEGGDRTSHPLSRITNIARRSEGSELPISPIEGEMAGRPEGGALALPSR
ncbi:MAG: hypothetical protein E5X46_19905, partial [Mesorhizobium sp.]